MRTTITRVAVARLNGTILSALLFTTPSSIFRLMQVVGKEFLLANNTNRAQDSSNSDKCTFD